MAANDVIARPVDLLELAGGNLVEADRGDELRVAVESAVDLLEDALRFDGHAVEVGPAKHRALAFGDLCDPGIEVTELAAERTSTRRCDQRLQRVFGIGDDAEIGAKDPADLRRLDIDVNELPARV